MKNIIYQASQKNRNIAHIYEHALLNFVEKELFKKDYLCGIDYIYKIYVIGNILIFSLEAEAKVVKLISDLIRRFKPSLESTKWAVQEISNKYFRPY